jgi:hypothetical protein
MNQKLFDEEIEFDEEIDEIGLNDFLPESGFSIQDGADEYIEDEDEEIVEEKPVYIDIEEDDIEEDDEVEELEF